MANSTNSLSATNEQWKWKIPHNTPHLALGEETTPVMLAATSQLPPLQALPHSQLPLDTNLSGHLMYSQIYQNKLSHLIQMSRIFFRDLVKIPFVQCVIGNDQTEREGWKQTPRALISAFLILEHCQH